MADSEDKDKRRATADDGCFDLELDGILYQVGPCTVRDHATCARWVRQYIGIGSDQLVGPIVGRINSTPKGTGSSSSSSSTSNNLDELLDNLELDPPGFSGDYVVELLGAQPITSMDDGTKDCHWQIQNSVIHKLREDLTSVGIAVCPDAVSKEVVEQWRRGILDAPVIHWQENGQASHIRSDLVQFIPRIRHDTNANTDNNAAPQQALDFLEHLVARVTHATPYSPLWRPNQGMVAHYLKSRQAHYTWHYDNERDQHGSWRNFRALTAILYLNQPNSDWLIERDGGALEYEYQAPNASFCKDKVPPIGGTAVLFDSRRIRHCVSPAYRDRLAVTQWFVSPLLGSDDDSLPKGPILTPTTHTNKPPSKRPRHDHDFCRVFNEQLPPQPQVPAESTCTDTSKNGAHFSFGFF